MTKKDFLEMIKKNGELNSLAEAGRALNAITDSITEALANKETVSLIGFGTFSTVDVPEKKGKIPNTDKEYIKPAHTAPKFKFGKTLKDAVQNAQ